MNSSTIRRSNLSKEKMAVLEALSKYKNEPLDNSLGVYVRPVDKEKELDMLWQNFKINEKAEKTPNLYAITGFIVGAVVMLVAAIIIIFSVKGINSVRENTVAPAKAEKMSLNFIPASNTVNEGGEIYTVQEGDTLEAIIIRFYGSYTPERGALVLKTNALSNPNKLSIGQILTIPVEQ